MTRARTDLNYLIWKSSVSALGALRGDDITRPDGK